MLSLVAFLWARAFILAYNPALSGNHQAGDFPMPGHGRPVPHLFSWMLASVIVASSTECRAQFSDWPAHASSRDSCELTDVCFVDNLRGFACGRRGLLLATDDGGTTWQSMNLEINCDLHDIQFISPTRGFVAGGFRLPGAESSRAVLFSTNNAGQTWEAVPGLDIPAVHQMLLDETGSGILIGNHSPLRPAGIFRTEDDCRTWTSALRGNIASWQAGSRAGDSHCVVASASGEIATIPEMTPIRARRNDGRTTSIHTIAFVDQELGFAAGDEGTFLQTSDGGVTWESPAVATAWPDRQMDFHALFQRDEWLWMAGNPGGQIFRYRAGDPQWQKFAMPVSSPVSAIHFIDSANGWATTVLGDILATRDGGETWSVQRRGARGTALLQVSDDPSGFSTELYSRFCHEQGYLGGAILFPDGRHNGKVTADDCSQALGRAGSSFFVTAPHSLVAGLSQPQQEGRDPLLREYLVRQIRCLQPRVIVVSPRRFGGSDRDLRTELVEAVREAALPECFPDQFSSLGLAPWQVSKVLLMIDGGGGDLRMSPGEYLPQSSSLLGDFSAPSRLLLGQNPFSGNGATFQTIHSTLHVASNSSSFMEAIERSDSRTPRRRDRKAAEGNTATIRLLASRSRQIQALLETPQTSRKTPPDFAARLANLCAGLDDATAGVWLMEAGEKLIELGKLSLGQDVLVYLVNRYPRHPMVVVATRRLYESLASAEVATIARVQREQIAATGKTPELPGAVQPLTRTVQEVRDGIPVTIWEAVESAGEAKTHPVQPAGYDEPLPGDLRAERLRYALAASQSLIVLDPGGLDTQELALSRIRLNSVAGTESSPENQLKDLANRYQDSPSLVHLAMREVAALGENATSAANRFGTNCSSATSPPWLDAWLDDPVWKGCRDNGSQLQLTDSQGNINATLLMAADNKFVYFAGSCSKASGTRYPEISKVRSRDPEMASGDRIVLRLDTDRDYLSCFELVFESSGLVADRCGPIRDWNPELYVANRQDDQFWYFEAAIPVNELCDPGAEPIWAVSASRQIRNHLASRWQQPERSKPAATVDETTDGQPGNTTTDRAGFDNWALVLMPWQMKKEEGTSEPENSVGSR